MEPDKAPNAGSTDYEHIDTTLRVPKTQNESDKESRSTDFGPIDTKVDPGIYVDKPGYSRTPSQVLLVFISDCGFNFIWLCILNVFVLNMSVCHIATQYNV